MKQVLQNLKSGETVLEDVPCPRVAPGQILIRTTRSLVSAGTERMLVDFGKANMLDKARQQPDKVRMVLDKVKTDGLMPTAIQSSRQQTKTITATASTTASRLTPTVTASPTISSSMDTPTIG